MVCCGEFWGVLGDFGDSSCCIGVRMFLVIRLRLFIWYPSNIVFCYVLILVGCVEVILHLC